MTEQEMKQLAKAMEKALALCAKVEKVAARTPPDKRKELTRLRMSAHSAAVNLGQAIEIKKRGVGG